MRFRVRRLLGVSALSIFFASWMSGCSGQKQEEEDMEVTEQGENSAAGDQEAADDAADDQQVDASQSGEQAATDEATADEGGDSGDAAQATAEAGDGSEGDLQEIIQEMNGQPQDATAVADTSVPPAAAPANPTTDSSVAAMPSAPAAQAPAQATGSGSGMPFQPGGSPAANGLPELGSKMAYVVEHGDTLAKIAQKIYGKTNRWNELAKLSGISNPSRIFPGDLVYFTLDEAAVPFAAAYESIQRSEEQVRQGDTLASIAKRVYGSTNGWRSIWRQNDGIDNPDVVPPGTTVAYIPRGASSAALHKLEKAVAKVASQFNNNSTTKPSKKSVSQVKKLKTANQKVMAKSLKSYKTLWTVANVSIVSYAI